jgi:D-3-phosphoglycerate dehydrogenase
VNRINAATVAQERGIRIHEEKHESRAAGSPTYSRLRSMTAGSTKASATVLHGEQPRLLGFDGMDIEAPLEGSLLVCRNLDVPGVIGNIGTVLGQQGVNIANFALGRERSNNSKAAPNAEPGKALSVVQVDEPVGPEVIMALGNIHALLEARLVRLG